MQTQHARPHPILASGHVRIGAAARAGAKSVSAVTPPPINDDFPGRLQPVVMSDSAGDHIFGLDLVAGARIDSVNADTPIQLDLPGSIAASDAVLIVGYDEASGLYLPIGIGNGSQAQIDRVPDQGLADADGKSIGGLLLMAAYKFAGASGITENPYPLLRSARMDASGAITYDEDGIVALRARVAAAKRIILMVHGFTGDTTNLLGAVPLLARQAVAPDPYDLVLAFDYENLNTRIQDSAALLKQRLADVGLSAGHGKTLHLVAHSLGTQVCRWFVEREGGAALVQNVVLLGAPNNGTPLAVLQHWLLYIIGLGLNGLLAVVAPWTILTWAVRALSALVAGAEKIDTTLDQLKPDSDFYKDLNRSDDPGVPYHVIIGDTFQVKYPPVAGASNAAAMFQNIFSIKTRDRIASLAFGNRPNDLAIGLISAQAVLMIQPPRSPAPGLAIVACDHQSYFAAGSPGLAELARVLAG